MEQPLNPTSPPPPQQPPQTHKSKKQKSKIPNPQDLIKHYESQGLSQQEASVKVVDDLQKLLFRVVSSGRAKNDRFSVLEMKLDSKPGYAHTFAIGVASAAAFRGVASVWPHVAAAVGQVWGSVRGVSDSKP